MKSRQDESLLVLANICCKVPYLKERSSFRNRGMTGNTKGCIYWSHHHGYILYNERTKEKPKPTYKEIQSKFFPYRTVGAILTREHTLKHVHKINFY